MCKRTVWRAMPARYLTYWGIPDPRWKQSLFCCPRWLRRVQPWSQIVGRDAWGGGRLGPVLAWRVAGCIWGERP